MHYKVANTNESSKLDPVGSLKKPIEDAILSQDPTVIVPSIVIKRMVNQCILDGAYQVAKKAHTSSTHAEAKDELQSMFPDAPWNEILDAYLKGSELAEKCYEIADIARGEGIPDDRAIEMLKQRFPGFSDTVYNDALTLGWFLSR